MATVAELVAILRLDDKFSSKLSDINASVNQAQKTFQERFGAISKTVGLSMTAAGAAITGLGFLTVKAAATAVQTQEAFERLAGESSAAILDSLRKASGGTVSASNLMLAANRAMVLGVAQNTDEFTTLMGIARDRARTMGLSVEQAFDNLVTGLGRGSPLILDNLGLMINAAEANEAYAQSIGKTASALTETERKQAILNDVLKQGKASLQGAGDVTATAAEKFQIMKAQIAELSVNIGSMLLPVVAKIAGAISEATSRVIEWQKEHPKLTQAIVLSVAAFGALSAVVGPFLLLLPALIAGIAALKGVMAAVPGPIGLITVGLTVAAAAAAGFTMRTVIGELMQTRDIANDATGALSRVDDRLKGISTGQREFVASLEGKLPSAEIRALGDQLGKVTARLKEIAQERQVAEGFARANTEAGQYTRRLQELAVEERELISRQGAIIAEIESVRTAVKETTFGWQELIDVMGDAASATDSTGRDFDALVQQLEAVPGAFAVIQLRMEELQRLGIGPVQAFKVATLEALAAVEKEIATLALSVDGGIESVAAMREAGVPLVQILGLLRLAAAQSSLSIDDLEAALTGVTTQAADATQGTQDLAAAQRAAVSEAERIIDSWNQVRIALDPAVQQFRASGLTVAQVVQGWANATGRSVDDIISNIEAMGISVDQLGLFWKALGIPLDQIIASFADVEDQADDTTAALKAQKAALLDLSNVATRAAGQGQVVVPASAAAIEGAFGSLRQNFQMQRPTAEFPVSLEQFVEMVKFFGGGVSALIPAIQKFANAFGLEGFQHGGSFTVGGRGGPDSQLVAFRATPGERVAVAPPGWAGAGAGGGITVVVQGPIYGFDDFERRVGQAVRNIKLRGGGM